MASIALIGADGAGKSTLTRMLIEADAAHLRCLYMGIETAKSHVALPTSRWAERLKRRREKGVPACGATKAPAAQPPRRLRHTARAAVRLANRLAEEWFRQCASWVYQARGFVVLYDRHFLFDFAPEMTGGRPERWDRRVHQWCLQRFYPRPDLTVFLDAPGEMLFARMGELTIEELERRRQAFLRIGKRTPGFVTVDATRPLSAVYEDVATHVRRLDRGRRTTVSAEELR